jgi:photosystem II stability/assembly factor-like uncharacterized protein
MTRPHLIRRFAILLLLVAAFGAGVTYFGFDPAGGAATGAPVVAAEALGDAPAPARSGGAKWGPSHGPEGGPALALAVAPSAPETVYVGTRGGGVFRSMNGGRSWTSAGLALQFPLTLRGVGSLAVDPRSPNTVYAGVNSRWDGGMTYYRKVWKTTNGGRTWRALGLKGDPVAISPTGPPTVYASAGGVGGKSRLFRSTDDGRSWQPADRGLPSTYLWALAFDPTAPTTVYAAMGRRGVFASGDSGASWRPVSISPAYREVTAIAVDPQHPRTVYAGTDAGVIKSLDGGRSWRMVNAAMGGHGVGREHRYKQVSALVVDPRDSRTVYATTRCAGVFKTTDGGRRWSPANAGLQPQCPWAYSLALDPRAPQTLYAADPDRGVFKSLDGGAQWHVANAGLLSLWYTISSVAVDPQRPRTVYASTGALGLFKSSDGGAHWRSLVSGLDHVDGVALDPSNPMNVLAAGSTHGVVRSARSTDAGRTWAEARIGAGVPGGAVVALSGETAYAGTTYGWGLFRSTDGGRSWRRVDPPGVVYVHALAIAPGDAAVAYVAIACCSNARGLYESTDGGRSWQRLTGAPDADVDAIALDPQNPKTVYIGVPWGEGAVFKSTDGGTSWQPANSGLHVGVYAKSFNSTVGVTALAIDPVHPTTLYAATGGSGVFRSTDSGKSWQSLNAGLTALDVRALALDATGQTLYAGTVGGGVVSVHPKR